MKTLLDKINEKKSLNLALNLKENEKKLILKAISTHKTMLSAARALGISERTMYRKLREFKIV